MDQPSLEALVESEDLGLTVLHPGALDITRELATLTATAPGSSVLEVAAGTGETASLIAREFGARVTAMDLSARMIASERRKLLALEASPRIVQADAHRLPFRSGAFDVALSECAVCHFDKLRAVGEMARVVRSGGRVGIHDLFWKDGAPASLQRRLLEIEQEQPGTLGDWIGVFESAGLEEVRAFDRSHWMAGWTREVRRGLGLAGCLAIGVTVLKRWGLRGLRRVLESERIFASPYLGYALVIGVKR